MSLPAIILGLLVWRSLPPFYRRGVSRKAYWYLRLGCKAAGILLIIAGTAAAFF